MAFGIRAQRRKPIYCGQRNVEKGGERRTIQGPRSDIHIKARGARMGEGTL